MKLFTKSARNIAIVALISYSFLGAIMGVWVRGMSTHFENFQQIAARAIVGTFIGVLLYIITKKIHIATFVHISWRDFLLIFARSIILLIGIGLFTFAINVGNYSNINMIYAIPSSAILGVVILKEKLTPVKFFALLLGCIGVVMITVKNFSDLSSVGIGELAAFISTFFYSLSFITRKYISKSLNNEEIAIIGSLIMGVCAVIISLLLGNNPVNFFTIDWNMWVTVVMAGLTFILIGVTGNYGIEHIEAIIASNIMTIETLFALGVGILLYKEAPTLIGFIGGAIIIASVIIINNADAKKFEK